MFDVQPLEETKDGRPGSRVFVPRSLRPGGRRPRRFALASFARQRDFAQHPPRPRFVMLMRIGCLTAAPGVSSAPPRGNARVCFGASPLASRRARLEPSLLINRYRSIKGKLFIPGEL